MFTHFSPQAQAAVDAAQAAARAAHHDWLGLEHLLIGVLRTGRDLPLPTGQDGGAPALATRLAAALPDGSAGQGRLKATAGAVAAIGQAGKLMTARHDPEVLPLHLLAAVLQGVADGTDQRAWLTGLGLDSTGWATQVAAALAALPAAPAHPGLPAPPDGTRRPEPDRATATPSLDRYGRDLTALARQGALPPLFGRERELRSLMEVLCKMTKNNPALVGEPGVGKTALVEGLAQRMAADKVPAQLRGRRLVELDLNAMVAGTRYRGDFEERLKSVLEETQKSHAVLFLDEMHTAIGAGDGEGGGDLANVLKPYLTRGEISVIGATTIAEYRRYIERDGALERRFQPLMVEEPSAEATLHILERLRPRFAAHYGTVLSDAVLRQVVELSRQYLRHRHFPDKAIDVLQLACARALLDSLPESDAAPPPAGDDAAACVVTGAHVRAVVADLAGIPLDHFAGNPDLAARYLAMEDILGESVYGQDAAITAVANALRLAKRQLDLNPLRPDGVFLFLGPPGVGKTELGRALGRFLFGDERHVIRLDMSEFSEPHSVSRLVGSPPGYVGHDEGGQLTERIRSQPFSLLMLDELEKAHPAVINLFVQVFDEGRLTDAHGRTVYFSDVTVVLTSNAGSERYAGRSVGFKTGRALDPVKRARPPSEEAALAEARKHFPSELISRIDKVILFQPLDRAAARRIVETKLAATLARVSHADGPDGTAAPIRVTYDPAVVDYVVDRGFSAEWGARHVERAIEDEILAPLARLTFRVDWPTVAAVHIHVGADGLHLDTTEGDYHADHT
jgi:ATP-dependent Clp protease ATP-binding subunit ClpC